MGAAAILFDLDDGMDGIDMTVRETRERRGGEFAAPANQSTWTLGLRSRAHVTM
jgi:hypothetical protein